MATLGKRITNEAAEIAEQVENWIDEYIENLKNNEYNRKKKLINLLKASKIKKSESKVLAVWFSDLKNELKEVLDDDPELSEGWDFLSNGKIKQLHEFVSGICDDLESYGKITKKKRKRKPEQVIKSLKYSEYGDVGKFRVHSFDPTDILTAKSFICFNTKTSDLCYYETEESFDIKGTTIQNFNSSVSYCQKIGRSAEDFLKLAVDGGVAFVQREMKKFTTKKREATGRINEHTILVRVIS